MSLRGFAIVHAWATMVGRPRQLPPEMTIPSTARGHYSQLPVTLDAIQIRNYD